MLLNYVRYKLLKADLWLWNTLEYAFWPEPVMEIYIPKYVIHGRSQTHLVTQTRYNGPCCCAVRSSKTLLHTYLTNTCLRTHFCCVMAYQINSLTNDTDDLGVTGTMRWRRRYIYILEKRNATGVKHWSGWSIFGAALQMHLYTGEW